MPSPVSHRDVELADPFWAPRAEVNRRQTIPHALDMLEAHGYRHNFDVARGAKTGDRVGYVFHDSDVYKVLEACAYELGASPNEELDRRVDEWIELLAATQEPDGYLNTYYQVRGLEGRWTNLRDHHELYCAGHLIEAAVAHHGATGKTNLLAVAQRFAEHLWSRFGPSAEPGYCGHPEIELALVALAQATRDGRWLDLAEAMVRRHGAHFFAREHGTPDIEYDGRYWQDHVPVDVWETLDGHAVRAAYLISGVADLAAIRPDPAWSEMLERVWRRVLDRRTFVTGGIGSSGANEGFTIDYDLPNRSAYQETCASIALAMWARRMAYLQPRREFADAMELALYNAVAAGVSVDGRSFFYDNPLASHGSHLRQEWFGCACCPPNIARTLAQIGAYAFAKESGTLWVDLLVAGTVRTELASGPVEVRIESNYPWSGALRIEVVRAPSDFELRVREPGWCRGAFGSCGDDGYTRSRVGAGAGAVIELDVPVVPRAIEAHPRVEALAGLVALAKGPIVAAVEQVDHDAPIELLLAPDPRDLASDSKGRMSGPTRVAAPWREALYRSPQPLAETRIRTVPYATWGNRAAGAMAVWLPRSYDPHDRRV